MITFHKLPFKMKSRLLSSFDETLEDAFKEEDIRLSSSQSRNRINEYLPC